MPFYFKYEMSTHLAGEGQEEKDVMMKSGSFQTQHSRVCFEDKKLLPDL